MISRIIYSRDTKEKAALLRLSLSWLLVRTLRAACFQDVWLYIFVANATYCFVS